MKVRHECVVTWRDSAGKTGKYYDGKRQSK